MARPSMLDSLSVADIQRLISARKSRRSGLLKERKALIKQIAKLDEQLASASGSGRRRGNRPRNEKPLADVIGDVLKSGKPMGIKDITAAVQAAGYKSSAANFRAVVNLTLIKDKRFHAPERGTYALKK